MLKYISIFVLLSILGCQTIQQEIPPTISAEKSFCSHIENVKTNLEHYFITHQGVKVTVELKYCTFVPFDTTAGYALYRATNENDPTEAQDIVLFFKYLNNEWIPVDVKSLFISPQKLEEKHEDRTNAITVQKKD